MCHLISQLLRLPDFFVQVVEAVDQMLSVLERFLFVVLQNVEDGFVRCR